MFASTNSFLSHEAIRRQIISCRLTEVSPNASTRSKFAEAETRQGQQLEADVRGSEGLGCCFTFIFDCVDVAEGCSTKDRCNRLRGCGRHCSINSFECSFSRLRFV